MHPARETWQVLETLHVVTYFSPESRRAAKEAGLKGFWMGYFAFRAAPLGAAPAPVVEATFANFAPGMVARAVPDAWSYADPASLLDARASSAAAALRALHPGLDDVAAEAADLLAAAVAHGELTGRTLFAANRALPRRDDPIEDLWQQCTSWREHRGDGHVAALVSAGLEGCEVHRVLPVDRRLDAEALHLNRGWTAEEIEATDGGLVDRGLLREDGGLTATGEALRAEVEDLTDALAQTPLSALGEDDRARVHALLLPAAEAVRDSGVLPFPNPVGLPRS